MSNQNTQQNTFYKEKMETHVLQILELTNEDVYNILII